MSSKEINTTAIIQILLLQLFHFIM